MITIRAKTINSFADILGDLEGDIRAQVVHSLDSALDFMYRYDGRVIQLKLPRDWEGNYE